jgi:hypothetical protein
VPQRNIPLLLQLMMIQDFSFRWNSFSIKLLILISNFDLPNDEHNPKDRTTDGQLLFKLLFRRILNTVVIPSSMQTKIKSRFWITEMELFFIPIFKI